jgi:hypothetical protein
MNPGADVILRYSLAPALQKVANSGVRKLRMQCPDIARKAQQDLRRAIR